MRQDWGCITKAGNNVWRIRYWASTTTGYRRCSETIRGTKRQAGDRLAELRIQHGHDAPCPTVRDCWHNWFLPDRKRMVEQGDLAPLTLQQNRSTWHRHVSPRWADIPCNCVRPVDVQPWLLDLRRPAAEASSHLLRQLLDYATRYEFLSTNPLAIRYLLPSASTIRRRDDGVWSIQELGEVWEACWGAWFEPAVLLAGFGGCRVGESLGVKTHDVRLSVTRDVPVAFARIERQIDSSGHESPRTKNQWSNRTVLLAGKPALRLAHIAQNAEDGAFLTKPEGCLHATQQQLRCAFKEQLEAHDTSIHLFKNLRKTWQTNARWTLGLPPWIVEPMMGHAGTNVTGRYYDKPSDEEFASALAKAWKKNPFGDEYPWLKDAAIPRDASLPSANVT